jgi:hypothetical protein
MARALTAGRAASGQSRGFDPQPATSGLFRLADVLEVIWHVSNVPILLQKSAAANGLSVILFNGDRL